MDQDGELFATTEDLTESDASSGKNFEGRSVSDHHLYHDLA